MGGGASSLVTPAILLIEHFTAMEVEIERLDVLVSGMVRTRPSRDAAHPRGTFRRPPLGNPVEPRWEPKSPTIARTRPSVPIEAVAAVVRCGVFPAWIARVGGCPGQTRRRR